MWFRNLRPFRLPARLGLDADALGQRLGSRPFAPAAPSQPLASGWVPALGDQTDNLLHAAGPFWLVRLQREEKLLPASVVREAVGERVAQLQAAQGRKVHRKERLAISDEVTQDLMPRAFSRKAAIEALIDEPRGWLWVNSASAPRAEDLVSGLREAIGSLPAELPATRQSPGVVMSEWLLSGRLPEGFALGSEVDLAAPLEGGPVVKARQVDLDSDEIRGHLDAGQRVERLALHWRDRAECIVDKDLNLRRLRFSEELAGTHDELADDPLARRDADFLLMSETVAELFAELLTAFGGLAE